MQIDLIQALKNYLTAFNIQLLRVAPPFDGLENFDYGLRRAIDPVFDFADMGRQMLEVQPDILTVTEDVFGARYALFGVPSDAGAVYLIGPWRGEKRTPEQIVWATRNLGDAGAAAVETYYNIVPQVADPVVYTITTALLSTLYPQDAFQIRALREYRPLNVEPDMRYFSEPNFTQEIPAAALEQRYAVENNILDAVAAGDTEAAVAAHQQFLRFDLGDRFSASLHHRKNSLIVFNTLLRKAIERAHVHPYYIDAISTKYSLKLENITSEAERNKMAQDMVLEYCAYVRRYSLKQYSPLVQKTINYINLHLDAALSLKKLAEICFISPSYLSTLFRQETGVTLTDYINAQRVQRAAQSLAATNSSISTIAASVGLLDVNYFSKIFKKIMGVTPSQYRRDHQKR